MPPIAITGSPWAAASASDDIPRGAMRPALEGVEKTGPNSA